MPNATSWTDDQVNDANQSDINVWSLFQFEVLYCEMIKVSISLFRHTKLELLIVLLSCFFNCIRRNPSTRGLRHTSINGLFCRAKFLTQETWIRDLLHLLSRFSTSPCKMEHNKPSKYNIELTLHQKSQLRWINFALSSWEYYNWRWVVVHHHHGH